MEKALMESRPRATPIVQTTEIVVLQLSREEFSSRRGSRTRLLRKTEQVLLHGGGTGTGTGTLTGYRPGPTRCWTQR